ncbi:g2568 [Coccomyxa viridis]|uniref:G2568 protein n=1 Tax=Coccomyxa viridis TaxID=1274662 RepID=A0ABP1FPE1_9CHLO
MDERREAPEVGLLSLPDELLTKIAKTTHSSKFDEGYRAWACAASTCKRLRDVQLSSISRVKHWTSCKWYLKRAKHVNAISFWVEEWPSDDDQLQELSTSLMEIPFNLQQLKRLDFWF